MSGNKLFVGGLTTETDEDGLRKAFSRWSVRDAIIVYDRETRRSRGFGYVTFAYPKDAEEAMNCMGGESGKGKEIFGRVLNIDYAKDKERESGGGGRGGRGGFRGGRGGGPQMRGRGPPGPPRGPPGRGDPYARGPRDGPPPRGRRGGPPMRGPPPPGPPPRRGPPEREPLRESYKDRYDERGYGPPPDRSYRSHEYDRAPYERERERPAPYQSDRGYGEKYPPPARGYSSTDRSYGGPPPERQYSSSDRYGGSYGSSERSDYDSDRYNGAVRYPPSDRSYSSERPAAYDRGSSSYTSTAERSYATERSYPANDRAGYGPPPSRERSYGGGGGAAGERQYSTSYPVF